MFRMLTLTIICQPAQSTKNLIRCTILTSKRYCYSAQWFSVKSLNFDLDKYFRIISTIHINFQSIIFSWWYNEMCTNFCFALMVHISRRELHRYEVWPSSVSNAQLVHCCSISFTLSEFYSMQIQWQKPLILNKIVYHTRWKSPS